MSTLTAATAPNSVDDALAHEVSRGLGAARKSLPAWMFYDERGSQLFEQITALPEYYLTRTERAILRAEAASLVAGFGPIVTVAELGAGSAAKTGVLLREFVAAHGSVLYQPIDISPSALEEAAVSLAATIPGVRIQAQTANYITEPYTLERPSHATILTLYIGSSIGNFSPAEAVGILRNLRSHLEPGDSLLLGVDLAPGATKSIAMLLAAYDDAAGVTAAFNKNVLHRLNRDLGANFDLNCFAHRARWNPELSRIEMHLESLNTQTVHIGAMSFHFRAGETIHTENSYKFTADGLLDLLRSSGFERTRTLNDPAGLFAVVLANAI